MPDVIEQPTAAVIPTPKPLNRVADEMEKAMKNKLQTLLVPFQDVAKKPVEASVTTPPPSNAPAQSQPASAPAQPAASPVVTPAPSPSPDPVIPTTDLPPEGMSKAGKEDWHRFRALKNAEIEKRDKELAALKADVEKLRAAKAIDPVEYETTKKTKEELEATVERLRLEESPKFKAYYDGGIEKQIKLIKAVGGNHGDELVKLAQSGRSKERNERIREIQEELGPEGYVIGNALGEIARLQLERTEQLSNWRENSEQLREVEAREIEAAKTRTIEQRRTIAERLIARARELPEFKPDPADKDHLAFTDGAVEFIRNATEGRLAEEDAALLPVAAMSAQYLKTIKLPRLEAENATLKARIAELTGARPQVNGQQQHGGQPASAPAQRNANDPYGVGEMTRKFNELLGRPA